MRVEKEKLKVNIICGGTSCIRGFVHINPGERIVDFLNDTRKSFIAVTEAEFISPGELHSLTVYHWKKKKKDVVILNKSAIKWVEQV